MTRKWPPSTIAGNPPKATGRFEDLPPNVRDAAKTYWRVYKYRYRELDEELETFMKCPLPYDPPLRGARRALNLKLADVAQKLGCTTSAYAALELRDVKGNASLNALRKAARAMDCDVVLAIRPRGPRRYSDVVWEELAPKAVGNALLWNLSGDRQARFLAYLVSELQSSVGPKS